MIWAKRAFGWAAIAGVMHAVAWAGYIHHTRWIDFENLEQRQAVIQSLDLTKFGPWEKASRYPSLYMKMQLLAPVGAEPQLVVRTNPRSTIHRYFERHRVGDIVDVWVDRRTGEIDDILAPEAPHFWHLLGRLLLTVGLPTSFVTLLIFISTSSTPKDN